MGEIVGAGLLAHAPTIMLPYATRLELNEGKEISLVTGLRRLKSEVFEPLKPDAVIVFDTHWFTTVEFVITGHERRQGFFTSEELPRGMSAVPYNMPGHPVLAKAVAEEVVAGGLPCIANADRYLPVRYATINLNKYLAGPEAWLSLGVCQTGETDDFLAVGEAVGRAIARTPGRFALIASGSMSHRFWPLKQLTRHEASDPVHIRTSEARAADLERLEWFKAGDHARVIDTMPEFLTHAPEGRFAHYLMMAGALGGRDWRGKGRLFSDYENATGTSQVHVWFD
jgi:3,4-dihydroxyphenylacetate 2,3-dioxygenase